MSNPFTVSQHPEQLETSLLIDESHHYDDPLPPKDLIFLQSINEHTCKIKSAQVNSRLSNIFPMFLVILMLMFYTLFIFYENHSAKRFTFEENVQNIESEYGNSQNLTTFYKELVEEYRPYFGKKQIGWLEYLFYYYNDDIYKRDDFKITTLIGWLIFFPGSLYILSSLAFFVPMTYLVADRKRQILYSYVDGIVMATRYEDAQFGYAGKMLAFKLFYIHPETGELGIHIYRPNVSHYTGFLLSSDTENHRFITFLNAYMQQGRDAVCTSDYYARAPLFCFAKNPLPADFEQQVEQILAKLDQEKEHHA
ncbi:hypothetical protein ACOZG6_002084 [Proteus mirabilis]|uniref:IdsE2 n=1 Tax=Proteus mirabilis TaxID=584 RepID=A0A2X2CLY7_PROMI|nr:hypothetical protein [Proteus mirabilis]EKU2370762.1 hypothetical protein [Proteus mirabilis]EKU7918939.1 hypothetical protein [Proteus mirabilis]EKU7922479.1 hypothetical protein [Proteus mirabilis]EKU8690556.1 hypothetical protein [Proteus mirabilis]EKU8704849.1 hypothetical protein [Proteus mirabilis]